MVYHPERCIGCGKCAEECESHSTRVLKLNPDTGKIDKDECCCIGCGQCALSCPTRAWTRRPEKFYKVILGGRTGRQTPRMGKMFLNWASEDVILSVLKNWQHFSAWVMDFKPEYLHGGHLIDRAGYHKFKELILEGVKLNPECLVAEDIFWTETEYRSNFNVKEMRLHQHAGPVEK
jgi:anaerobic sulfite reductase subunit C